MEFNALRMGIDVGSTTVKVVLLDHQNRICHHQYRRHNADVRGCITGMFSEVVGKFGTVPVMPHITGSAGMSFAEGLGIPFVQEVIACMEAVETRLPGTDVSIELGGEDAKVTFFGVSPDQRMNGTCAGGTGAFIDQMASLLDTDPAGLDGLASRATTVYPIAARCGVFAKTDIQPLLNEGAARENIAASIFQAVVNQTIGGLAQGRPITGQVAFLGGPLHFLPSLRRRFAKTLDLKDHEMLVPEESPVFVALGAALLAGEGMAMKAEDLLKRLKTGDITRDAEIPRLRPLFENREELEEFRNRHSAARVERRSLESHSGPCYLGIDAGSTTTKAALIDDEGRILFSSYGPNGGSPLNSTIRILRELYGQMPGDAFIAGSTVTGYGENLLKAAIRTDYGEIETVAHYKAAEFFLPGVDFILDIGGQDMKFLSVRDGVIDRILLNEACSSGCGSFIDTFAASLGDTVKDFAARALLARQPVDLGSRCTVFMNSRVKQAQKEGLTPGDISAGLSYSVIKNALNKVIKIKRPEDYGQRIIVQGGTFKNEAVLRAFELISGREAVRPDICGIAGAFGSALIARERSDAGSVSGILGPAETAAFGSHVEFRRCEKCANRCRLTITAFSDGRKFVSGNRCERGAGAAEPQSHSLPNLYKYRYRRIFSYEPLAKEKSRASVGIPRALNMYENYPFWFTFLTELGYRVELSKPSGKRLFESGLSTIPAESVCYPAKLTHGHIADLLSRNVDIIFYPSAPFEKKEDPGANNHFNCPIVAGYPELIRANVDGLDGDGPEYMDPFVNLDDGPKLRDRLVEIFAGRDIPEGRIRRACRLAEAEMERTRQDIRNKGEETLALLEKSGERGIILAGRPYHTDPAINHGIPELIAGMGMAVLTEDSVAHLGKVKRPLRVFDQWTYHSRLYRAAHTVTDRPYLEMVQLNSFGCGIDAVTADQVYEILHSRNRIHTLLKIDEGQQLGAARIRLRSLKAVLDERGMTSGKLRKQPGPDRPVRFSRKMKKSWSIIAPQMSPIHFRFVETAFQSTGYRLAILKDVSKDAVEKGLKYVNNDACYPTIITVGQIMEALESGEYHPDRTAVVLTQTGGGCRATNYIAFMRKALADAGMSQVPVVSLNASGLEKHPGFRLKPLMLHRALQGVVYGDLLMRVLLRTRPYEQETGSADALYEEWSQKCTRSLSRGRYGDFRRNVTRIIRDFDRLPLKDSDKPRIGLVGEILVKFHPDANNNAVRVVESEGGEAVVPDLFDFLLYCCHNAEFRKDQLSGSRLQAFINRNAIRLLETYRQNMKHCLRSSKRFEAPGRIDRLARRTSSVVSPGIQMGEGWFLTGEMIELIESGTDGIICMQPFACLPNQITGKGMIKALTRKYPSANITAIDYDPGASEVNQLNRIKLMISVARRRKDERRSGEYENQIA